MHILIVEDNPRTRQLIKDVIRHNVPDVEQVYECDDGREAVELFKKHKPDWVVMDINLKEVDGLTATSRILHFQEDARIIILTFYEDPAYQLAAEKVGASAFVSKTDLFAITKYLTETA
jgi:DNA-binding NarL/FixJ family response regulator